MSIGALCSRSWELLKSNAGAMIGYPLLLFVMSMGVYMASSLVYVFVTVGTLIVFGEGVLELPVEGLEIVGYLILKLGQVACLAVLFLCYALAIPAGAVAYLRIARGQPLKFSDTYTVREQVGPSLGAFLLVTLVHLVLSSPLFAIMAVYGTDLETYFSVSLPVTLAMAPVTMSVFSLFLSYPMLLVDKRLGAVDAIAASMALGKEHFWTFIGIMFGGSFVVYLSALFTCGMALIVTTPMFYMMLVLLYDAATEPGNAYLDGASTDTPDFEVFI